ncbi:glycosyltransferase family A protein [Streptosporangium soli]|nr:glycosyltransferase family 2 protein [Streptosporangium sp. KLBMP 9127]
MLDGVSVIIPNYNYAKTLRLCLEAIYRQTAPPREVIVVDDNSTDNSVDIASGFPCRIIRTEKNSGVAAARNVGAISATGDILFFVDSDVVLQRDAIAEAVRHLREDDSIGSVCGIYAKAPLIRDSLLEEYRSFQAHYWRKSSVGLVSVGFFSLGAIRRDAFNEIGLFNEELWQTEEVDYGYRLSRRYGLLLSDRVVGSHDDDDKLIPLMRKLFRRARLRVPLYLGRRRFMTGFETRERALGVLAAGVACAFALASLYVPLLSMVAVLALIGFIISDAGMYGFVWRERGVAFLCYFTVIHYIVALAVGAGVAAGIISYFASSRFRGLYDKPAAVEGGHG